MKQLTPFALILMVATPCLTASAGQRSSLPLSINLSTHTASGALGSVRAGGNSGDWIDCQIQGDFPPGSGFRFVQCDAGTAGPLSSISCTSSDSSLIFAAQAMQSDSWVSFKTDTSTFCNGGPCCTDLTVYTGSRYLPLPL